MACLHGHRYCGEKCKQNQSKELVFFPKTSKISSYYIVSFVRGLEWREALTYFVYIVIKLKNDRVVLPSRAVSWQWQGIDAGEASFHTEVFLQRWHFAIRSGASVTEVIKLTPPVHLLFSI